jgi:hypothetical protein
MAKYDPLGKYFEGHPGDEITLSFQELERILDAKLPPSAYNYRAWWANEKVGVHVSAKAWMGAAWKVDTVNQSEHWVRFVRQGATTKMQSESFQSQDHKETMFTANRPNKTVVIHKPECREIPKEGLDACGCGNTGGRGNQRWWCERHITAEKVDEFMNGRHWAILMCDVCFREKD